MKKLIELDSTLDALKDVIVPAKDIGFGDESTDGYNDGINMAVTVVSGLPTVDAVEVVRCRECRWCNMGECEHKFGLLVSNDENYCSYGERSVDI